MPRDYIHIIDLAKGHVHAMKLLFGEDSNKIWAYNLGTGKPHSVLDVIKAFEGATGKKIPYEVAGRRTGDIDSLCAATKLVENELGWKAKFSMKDMCELLGNDRKISTHSKLEIRNKFIHFTLCLHASRFQVRTCGRGSRRTRRATILIWRRSDL